MWFFQILLFFLFCVCLFTRNFFLFLLGRWTVGTFIWIFFVSSLFTGFTLIRKLGCSRKLFTQTFLRSDYRIIFRKMRVTFVRFCCCFFFETRWKCIRGAWCSLKCVRLCIFLARFRECALDVVCWPSSRALGDQLIFRHKLFTFPVFFNM